QIRARKHPNHRITVQIEDNGCGIPANVLPNIFDPFFTTKPVGKGTGLGLSVSHGIISNHGGRIEVTSTPGQATIFTVTLPWSNDVGAAIPEHPLQRGSQP
ncbi:MAG: hypothetical protein KFF50_14200, partial [Desulfatitalea sp.]|nr:hypothetical protein [Desulfatitalea sp.]